MAIASLPLLVCKPYYVIALLQTNSLVYFLTPAYLQVKPLDTSIIILLTVQKPIIWNEALYVKACTVPNTHPCYKTDFSFAKIWVPKVTLGLQFWILNQHSVQVWGQNELVHLLVKYAFRKCMFCVHLYGKWVSWWCYNLYFEAFWVITQKRTKIDLFIFLLFLIFAENVTLQSRKIIKLIHFGASTSKSMQSLLSTCNDMSHKWGVHSILLLHTCTNIIFFLTEYLVLPA